MRPLHIALVFLLGVSSCKEKQVSYEDQFGLQRFTKSQYDLYNPLVQTFRADSVRRKSHPPLEVYFDRDTATFIFCTDGDYGYLQQLSRDSAGRLQEVKAYPILGGAVDKGARVLRSQYYYEGGRLILLNDELLDRVVVCQGDSAFVYMGVLTNSSPLRVARVRVQDYFTWFLGSTVGDAGPPTNEHPHP